MAGITPHSAPATRLAISDMLSSTQVGIVFPKYIHNRGCCNAADEYLSFRSDIPKAHLERRSQTYSNAKQHRHIAHTDHARLGVPKLPLNIAAYTFIGLRRTIVYITNALTKSASKSPRRRISQPFHIDISSRLAMRTNGTL